MIHRHKRSIGRFADLFLDVLLVVLLAHAGCAATRAEQAGERLVESLPAATKAIQAYTTWLRSAANEAVVSCRDDAKPRACARTKLAALRASQAAPLAALKAVARPASDAITGLLGPEPAAPLEAAAPPCTPAAAGRPLAAGEVICPTLPVLPTAAIRAIVEAAAPAPRAPAVTPAPTPPAPPAPAGGGQ